MPKFFTKKKERCNLRSRSKNQSSPKSKVDTCVDCDLPFDESKIAPELRRGPVTKEWTSSELLEPSHKNSVAGLTRPTWYPWILVLIPTATTVSVPWPPAPQSSRRIWGRTLFRKKKKERTVRITFLQQVINGYPRVCHLLLVIFHLLVHYPL